MFDGLIRLACRAYRVYLADAFRGLAARECVAGWDPHEEGSVFPAKPLSGIDGMLSKVWCL